MPMGKNYEDPIVTCPFYSWERGKQMCCEGVTGRTSESSIQITFQSRSMLRRYERFRCKKDWKNCPLAQALEKKWEEELFDSW